MAIHKEEDLIGKKYGLLTILMESPRRGKDRYVKCVCECGKEKNIYLYNLLSGKVRSCGCLNKWSRFKHGFKDDPIYRTWKRIKSRCYRPQADNYKYYGGRGIGMCDEWRNNPISFVEWAKSNGYKPSLTIDRIDNDKDYSPLNCRFVDMVVQSNNRRNNVKYEYNGIFMTLPEICRKEDVWEYINKIYYEVGKMGRDIQSTINKIKG